MTPQISPAASRYANAFLDIVIEKKAQKAVGSDIESLKSMITDIVVFAEFVKNVTISRVDQIKSIDGIAKKAKFHELTGNFLKLLATNNRLSELVDMINAYDVVFDERHGNQTIFVTSAFPIKAAQEKTLKAELDKVLGTNTEIMVKIDKNLLGGVVVTVGSKMIDDSVRGKLDRLVRKMKSTSGANDASDLNVKEG